MVAVTTQIVVACCFSGDCCDCIEPVLKNYSNLSMTLGNLDNSGEKPIITNSKTVPKNAYGIGVSFQRELVACSKKSFPTFFQSAYAFSCNCPPELQIMAKDSITAVKIFTVYDFDDSHSARSDISDYFKVYKYNSFVSIAEYLNSMNDYIYSGWTLYDESELEFEVTLLLMTTPKIDKTNKFKVQVTLSDGRVLEQDTDEIDFI